MNSTSWLSTDDILFLFAFLLYNQDANRWLHVLGPAIMNKVHAAYTIMEKAKKEVQQPNQSEQKLLDAEICDIQKYIDTRLDIMENKFLIFVCNISSTHWISIVVVNPWFGIGQILR